MTTKYKKWELRGSKWLQAMAQIFNVVLSMWNTTTSWSQLFQVLVSRVICLQLQLIQNTVVVKTIVEDFLKKSWND